MATSYRFVALRRRASVFIALTAAALALLVMSGNSTASAAQVSVLRINAGGAAFIDSKGQQWQADEYYSNDGWTYSTTHAIAGAAGADQQLYQTERSGNSGYHIPVTNGQYTLRLYMAEIYPSVTRIFSVTAEGQPVVTNFNLKATAGEYTAYNVTKAVTVNDGYLDLGLTSTSDFPKISGIELLRDEVTTTTAAPTTSTTARPTTTIPPTSTTIPPTTTTVRPTTTTVTTMASTTTTAPPTTTTTVPAPVLTQPVPTGTKPGGVTGTWKLKFNDEFNTSSLNISIWSTCSWVLQSGCRPSNGNEVGLATPNNVVQTGGSANLIAKHETKVSSIGNQTFNYTTGSIATGPSDRGPSSYTFKYGYAEARIKTAAGAGMWSAFWLDPADLSWPPEVDITEQLGNNPTNSWANLHWGTETNHQQSGQWLSGPTYAAGYHTFGVDWEPTYVTWYIDGVARRTIKNTQATIPSVYMFPVINLSVGGWGGTVNNAALPATMSIDYIRIWQK